MIFCIGFWFFFCSKQEANDIREILDRLTSSTYDRRGGLTVYEVNPDEDMGKDEAEGGGGGGRQW